VNVRTLTAALIAATLLCPAPALARSTDAQAVRHRIIQPSMRSLSKKRHITRDEYRYIARDACKRFGVKESKRDMVVRWGIDIVWRLPGKPAHESSGSTRASNPPYAGLKQFDRWRATPKMRRLAKKERHVHPRGDWRLCGVCATRRYVIAVRDHHYSKAGVRVHWPTLGR